LVVDNVDPLQIIHIYTSKVNIDFNKKFLDSLSPVKSTQNKSVVYATGFSYDKEKQFLTLKSKVKVIYEK
jgi:lipopolysaccharide export system protein LptC